VKQALAQQRMRKQQDMMEDAEKKAAHADRIKQEMQKSVLNF
jgi:hypothetical protein